MHYFSKILIILLLLVLGCNSKEGVNENLEAYIEAIKKEHAPDKRVALFNIEGKHSADGWTLIGESNLPDAVFALKGKLNEVGLAYTDSIKILPDASLKGKHVALVTNSVANLRSEPKHSAELSTQATLGTPVKVWKKEGGWYYIQTPDKYLAWVNSGEISLMTDAEQEAWTNQKKIIYTNTYGHVFSGIDAQTRVSDLVAGSILETTGEGMDFYTVRFPDGREGFVKKEEASPYNSWLGTLDRSQESLVATSKTLMGVPYLWGGTSTKGMDCSGFTKTIYFLNGLIIPRDASQQVHAGVPIDSTKSFDQLQKGDLLFFGRKATDSTAEKVVHVGMWIGNNEFIHASDRVRISSMDKDAENYDEYNLNRYLRSKRVLGQEDEALINLERNYTFYNSN
ncbi:glycoside hydrolase [Maribacter algicola]|uniref:Glycoside hydrolase n=1 Tax=Maribacter algicola TaxID=2498892 RepID=A0A3R8Q5J3_9FLAO|nr:SH3 domain-containing C40 family peptidase [Maribacter algicola]RRQ50062.1 glycoside hydrolase [Maribacter algicola]